DLVVRRQGGIGVRRIGPRHLEADDGDLTHVVNRDGGLTGNRAAVSAAAGIDRGDLLRIALVRSGGRHVPRAAVREQGRDQYLLIGLETEKAFAGADAQTGAARGSGGAGRHPLLDPFVQQHIVVGTVVDAPAAAV